MTVCTLVILTVSISCKNKPDDEKNTPEIAKGEECSLKKVSDLEFTKSINGAEAAAKVEGDKLILESKAEADNFNDPNGKLSNNSAPVLLTEIDNSQAFTFTAKLSPTFRDTYDAGTLYIYLNPDLWFKFAFELDERDKTRIVSVRTIETSDDNNHDVVNSESVYLKISSDTETIGFYYSLDKEDWQLVRLFRNDYPKELWAGLSSQSPIGEGTRTIFEELSLTRRSVKDFRMGK